MAEPFLIKKPWITEKAGMMQPDGKYVFMVQDHATKPEIKKAIKAIYKVDAVAVNVINRPSKTKRSNRGLKSSQGAYRKAVVTLKSGQKIDIQ
jgi:large subunit ribosomal protein L23